MTGNKRSGKSNPTTLQCSRIKLYQMKKGCEATYWEARPHTF